MPSETLTTVAGAILRAKTHLQPRRIEKLIIHHTWVPTAAQYQGPATIQGIRRYHMETRGWTDTGYHIVFGPQVTGDPDVWFCRPLNRSGAHTLGQNSRSVGFSYVANFDRELPEGWHGLDETYSVIAAFLRRYGLGTGAIHFHRDYADKSCPGKLLDLATYRRRVALVLEESGQAIKVVWLRQPPLVISCGAVLVGGTTMVDAARLGKALGIEASGRKPIREVAALAGLKVTSHIPDQGKVYLHS